MSFALVLALLNGADFTVSVAKNVALFETVPIRTLRFASVKWLRCRGSKHRNKRSNSGCIEKMKQINFLRWWLSSERNLTQFLVLIHTLNCRTSAPYPLPFKHSFEGGLPCSKTSKKRKEDTNQAFFLINHHTKQQRSLPLKRFSFFL